MINTTITMIKKMDWDNVDWDLDWGVDWDGLQAAWDAVDFDWVDIDFDWDMF